MKMQPTDYAPLDEFPLRWRWSDPAHFELPEADLANIRPLTAAAAARIAPEARTRCAEAPIDTFDETFLADDDDNGALERLERLNIPHSERVLASWDDETAVETDWGTFIAHWNAFCYPSSDDVTVWAPGKPWTLCYRHFEIFQFRTDHSARR